MTIKSITFTHPIQIGRYAPGGTDFYTPAKYEKVTAARKDAGILLSYDGEHLFVPYTNVAAVIYTEEASVQPGKPRP